VQMWQQTIKNLTGKGGEQPVFSRTLRVGGDRHQ